MSKINLPDLFTCAGCNEYAAGKRLNCQECDFQLHDFCALPPYKVIKFHPFHYQLLFHFNLKLAEGGIAKSKRDACGKPAKKGYAFRCGACSNFQIHPSYRRTVCEYHLHVVCAKSIVNGLQDRNK